MDNSGSTPTGFLDNMGILTTLPQPDAIAKLFELDINLVAIHNGTPNQQRRELLSYFGQPALVTDHCHPGRGISCVY